MFLSITLCKILQLEQMDLEVRELPISERGKLMGRMKSYQTEFNRLESQIVSQ